MRTRRQFLMATIVGSAAACRRERQPAGGGAGGRTTATPLTPGAPPAFGTGPESGPAVSPATFAEAEKLAQVTMSAAEREVAAASWRKSMAPLLERRVGPRKVALDPDVAPATLWNPTLPGEHSAPARDLFVRSTIDPGPLPSNDVDIAYAPVTSLSRWIEKKAISSERLTNIYLQRIEQF